MTRTISRLSYSIRDSDSVVSVVVDSDGGAGGGGDRKGARY